MRSASRLVLAAMLFTFLSPSFGWQVNATHDEIEHAFADVAVEQGHEHGSGTSDDHEGEAHGAIGHLLGHLPAFLSSSPAVPDVPPVSSYFAEIAPQWHRIAFEPPLRPPRFS